MGPFNFLVCPLALSTVLRKKMDDDDAQTQKIGYYYARFECVIDTKRHNMPPSVHLHTQKNMYNKTPKKICVLGSTKMYLVILIGMIR